MVELITILLFLFSLFLAVITNTNTIYPLVFGLICFTFYALYKKHTLRDIFKMICDGVKTIKSLIIFFIFIGMLTAIWRSGGTIAYIIYHSISLINPKYFILCTFLLCSIMSYITGTSLGTVGTIGIVCMTIAKSIGIDPIITGGAILSGIYFGDRCSPMSGSALLICEITKTDIYKNIKLMISTSLIPFLLTCIFYLMSNLNSVSGSIDSSSVQIYKDNFNLSLITLIPALIIIVSSIFKCNVSVAMVLSILSGVLCSVFVQHMSLSQVLNTLLFGFQCTNSELASVLSGGGISSMIEVTAIVAISSTYYTIFNATGLLNGLKRSITKTASKITPFGTTLFTALITNAISCNQTLATLLTYQINEDVVSDNQEMAIFLENSAIIFCGIIPWNIGCSAPLAAIGASLASIKFAFFMFLIPLWNFCIEIFKFIRNKNNGQYISINSYKNRKAAA